MLNTRIKNYVSNKQHWQPCDISARMENNAVTKTNHTQGLGIAEILLLLFS